MNLFEARSPAGCEGGAPTKKKTFQTKNRKVNEKKVTKKRLLRLPMKPCEEGVLLEMFLGAFFRDSLGDCRMEDLDVNCWKVSDHLGRSSRLVGA